MTELARRSRLVSVLGVVASVAVLARAGPALSRWNEEQQAHAARARRQVIELRAGLARRNEMQRLIAVQRELIDSRDEWLLAAEDSVVSDAALSAILEAAAEEAGVQLMAVQAVAGDSSRGETVRLRARATVAGDLEAVMHFLAVLEDAPSRLAVREMMLAQPNVAIARSQAETMRVELVVEALSFRRDHAGLHP